MQIIYLKIGPNWPNWQCCLAGSSKMTPRILIFSIAMCADYSFYVKSIATFALTLFGYIILVFASAFSLLWRGTFSSWTTEKVLFYINSELSFLGTRRYSQRSCVQFSDHNIVADQFAGLGSLELSILLLESGKKFDLNLGWNRKVFEVFFTKGV